MLETARLAPQVNKHDSSEGTKPTSTRFGFGSGFGSFCSSKLLCIFFTFFVLGCTGVALSSYGYMVRPWSLLRAAPLLLVSQSTAHDLNCGASVALDANALGPLDPSWPGTKWLQMVHGTPDRAWKSFFDASMLQLGSLDREGKQLATMSTYACCFNYAAGASVTDGLLVEFGTWAGGSMRCFAAGIQQTGHPNRAIGFDAFKAGFIGSNAAKLRGTRWWDPKKTDYEMKELDLLPIYNFNVQDVYPTVRAQRVNFREHREVDSKLSGTTVDVFITDAAKSAAPLAQDIGAVAPYLRPGSILVFADFFFTNTVDSPPAVNQVLFVFGQLVSSGMLRLLGLTGSYGYFLLMRGVSRDSVSRLMHQWELKAKIGAVCKNATVASIKAMSSLLPETPKRYSDKIIPKLRRACRQ